MSKLITDASTITVPLRIGEHGATSIRKTRVLIELDIHVSVHDAFWAD
ncbi:MAG: hypothetical protein K8L99_12610 [Anaerolineae bacterium]|nr:hypothetical protein [Anaerolineae bacterium]